MQARGLRASGSDHPAQRRDGRAGTRAARRRPRRWGRAPTLLDTAHLKSATDTAYVLAHRPPPGAHPIRPPVVAATDNGRRAEETRPPASRCEIRVIAMPSPRTSGIDRKIGVSG